MTHELKLVPKITDIRSVKPFHAYVTIEPLGRGLGHTLGNALRRVMMSSIPGFAATEVKIDGVVHEYDRVLGMREDVIWLLLNLKKVVFKIHDADKATVHIKKSGPCVLTAGDIETPHNVEILNKSHVLATLAPKGALDMEIIVEKGVGYEAAAARDVGEGKRFGVIYLDALFSPVRRVAFQVESARVENRTDLDSLILEIETNGVFTFEDVIRQSALILTEQLSVFTNVEQKRAEMDIVSSGETTVDLPLLSEEVSTMDLTVRSQNCLRQENIRYIGELVQRSERDLMKTPHLGKKSLVEIKSALARLDLTLDMELPNWTSPR